MNASLPAIAVRLPLPRHYRVEHADAAARVEALALRRAVFCAEQGLFDGSDEDAIDTDALLLVARPCVDGGGPAPVVGTVRIHRLAPDVWQGSRLAVAAEYRRVGALGGALIQLAVRSAATLGCTRFVAQVQAANVPLFQRLHWRSTGEIALHGRPHHLMEADLAHYPPFAAGAAMRVDVKRGA